MNKITYRKFNLDDIDSYIKIRAEMLLDSPKVFGMSYEDFSTFSIEKIKSILDSAEFTFGAFVDNIPVAMLMVQRRIGRKVEHTVIFVSIYCSPEFRGKGVAKKLITEAVEVLRNDNKTKQILLQVVISNEVAISLYESVGFEKYGTEPATIFLDGIYYDEYLMALKI